MKNLFRIPMQFFAEPAEPDPAPAPDPAPSDSKPDNEPASAPDPAPDVPSAEELEAFRKWQASQQSESEKHAAAIKKAESAKTAAEKRAAAAELKLTAFSKGVTAEAVDDVIALAKSRISDKVTAEQAIDEIVKKYPAFTASVKPGITTGVRTGGNTQPAASAKAIDIIRAEQVKRS
ncbi:MAG: hypothetical protein E7511_05810 [Ruminococcus sp.]|nr:hypothetical protein [Ruminococcus sp.]